MFLTNRSAPDNIANTSFRVDGSATGAVGLPIQANMLDIRETQRHLRQSKLLEPLSRFDRWRIYLDHYNALSFAELRAIVQGHAPLLDTPGHEVNWKAAQRLIEAIPLLSVCTDGQRAQLIARIRDLATDIRPMVVLELFTLGMREFADDDLQRLLAFCQPVSRSPTELSERTQAIAVLCIGLRLLGGPERRELARSVHDLDPYYLGILRRYLAKAESHAAFDRRDASQLQSFIDQARQPDDVKQTV